MARKDIDEHPRSRNDNEGLFDEATSRYVKEEAIKRVEKHTHEEWKDAALEAVRSAALKYPSFTTDEVWPLIKHDPMLHDPRSLGPVMRRAEGLGYINPTALVSSSDSVSRHRAPKRIWQSLLLPLPRLRVGRWEWKDDDR